MGVPEGDTVHMRHSQLLTMIRYSDDVVRVSVTNPWDSAAVPRRYLMVSRQCNDVPTPEPDEIFVRTPLSQALIYAVVHSSLAVELGAADAVAGVTDGRFVQQEPLARRIASGQVVDCGTNQSPDIEKIINLAPDGILLSPYQNSGVNAALAPLGIPLIETADYLEPTPLGRAEWIRFYGLLFGCTQQADSLFASVECQYNMVRHIASTAIEKRPSVIVDAMTQDVWYQPGAKSATHVLINDAGGINPFARLGADARELPLTPEEVLSVAQNAQVWLLRYWQSADKTLASLGGEHPVYSRFASFAAGTVYGCNTAHIQLYEQLAFHPHMVLADMVRILHPSVASKLTEYPHYYTPMP